MNSWTPQRLDVLDAFEYQLNFFASKGYLTLAENRFLALIRANRHGQKMLRTYEEISDIDRNRKLQHLRQQLKRILFRYRKYTWNSIRNRVKKLWLNSDTFIGRHIILIIRKKIKSFGHSHV